MATYSNTSVLNNLIEHLASIAMDVEDDVVHVAPIASDDTYKIKICIVPQNQDIYQALIDKANSYPSDQPYKAKAYRNAADSIANYPTDIRTYGLNDVWYSEFISGVGLRIEKFINTIKTHTN